MTGSTTSLRSEVTSRDDHTDQHHGGRGDHVVVALGCVVDDGREVDLCHQQHESEGKGDQRRIGDHFFQIEALAVGEDGVAVRPEQYVKGDLKGAAVKYHLIAQ